MSGQIEIGYTVMLIFACCPVGRQHIGWIGAVEDVGEFDAVRCFCCDYVTRGKHALVDMGTHGYVPLSWLRRMPPEEETQGVREVEEISV